MKLQDAEKLALALMKEFKLVDRFGHMYDADFVQWRFEFDSARRRFGCCHRGSHLITLSRELVERNDQAQVEDTIRHEIAHALCEPREGHGDKWKKMCKVTGANPQRCYDDLVDAPVGDWQATCGVCGTLHTKFRKPKRDLFCARKECKKIPVPYISGMGQFHPARKLVWRNVNAIFDPTVYAKDVLGVAEINASQLSSQTVAGDLRKQAIAHMKAELLRQEEVESMKEKIAELEKKLGRKI